MFTDDNNLQTIGTREDRGKAIAENDGQTNLPKWENVIADYEKTDAWE